MSEHDTIAAIAAAWLAAPTEQPLTLYKTADGVQVFQGVPALRMSQADAARFLGISINTFKARFLAAGLVRIGADGRISRTALRRTSNDLDGRL